MGRAPLCKSDASAPLDDASPQGRALVRVEGLVVSYGTVRALDGIDLTIQEGERLAVIGPNGAGKTTLLNVLLGLLAPSAGSVTLATPAPRLGYVPQKLHFDAAFPITAAEFLEINSPGSRVWFGGVSRRKRERIMAALASVGAADCSAQKLGALSGGQFQRVLIAAALLQEPDLLILDEPSASVDQRGADELTNLLLSLNAGRRLSLVFVSHDLHLVNHLAVRVACLNRTLCCLGSPADVLCEAQLSRAYGSELRRDRLTFVSPPVSRIP